MKTSRRAFLGGVIAAITTMAAAPVVKIAKALRAPAPVVTDPDIVSATFSARNAELAKNIKANNILLRHLSATNLKDSPPQG